MGTRCHIESGQGSMEGVRVYEQWKESGFTKNICDERPVNRDIVKVLNPVAGKTLLTEMSIGEALQGCFAESVDCLLPISVTAMSLYTYDFLHMCSSLISLRGGWSALIGVIF
ncbi:hypothetical protein BsWGS_01545 [Bradybaena similaris]